MTDRYKNEHYDNPHNQHQRPTSQANQGDHRHHNQAAHRGGFFIPKEKGSNPMKAQFPINPIPVVNGEHLLRDEYGRVSLNALHSASGSDPKDRPNQWLRLEKTKTLIGEAQMDAQISAFVTVRGGAGGSFAIPELAVQYASWISPAFALKVSSVFLQAQAAANDAPALPPAYLQRLEQDSNALQLLAQSEGSLCIRDAGTALNQSQDLWFEWLHRIGWIYKRGGVWLPYSEQVTRGYLEVNAINPKGRMTRQTRITAKGMTYLAQRLEKTNGVLVMPCVPVQLEANQ